MTDGLVPGIVPGGGAVEFVPGDCVAPSEEVSWGFGGVFPGGPYWDRTSDLFRVKEARYRCANGPRLLKFSFQRL